MMAISLFLFRDHVLSFPNIKASWSGGFPPLGARGYSGPPSVRIKSNAIAFSCPWASTISSSTYRKSL